MLAMVLFIYWRFTLFLNIIIECDLIFFLKNAILTSVTYSHVRLIFLECGSHLRDMMDRQLKNSTAVTQEHILYTNFWTVTLLLGMTLKAHTGVWLWEAFELKKTTNSTYHCFGSCGWICRQAASSDCSWTWLHSSGPGYREICREKNTALWETCTCPV